MGEARKRLGLREVRALEPGEIAWDSTLPGFAARRQRSETLSYVLNYRAADGRSAAHTIGRHGSPWTPETARSEAKRLLGMIEDGADPAADKIARDGKRRRSPNSPNALPRRACRGEAQGQHRGRIPAAARQDHPAGARQAEGGGRDPRRRGEAAPCQPRGALPGQPRARRAGQDVQSRRAAGACGRTARTPAAMSRNSPSASASGCCRRPNWRGSATRSRPMTARPIRVAAVKLLVFTGARLGEVLGLRWEWIDFERGEARLPDSKTGAKTLHLAAAGARRARRAAAARRQPLCHRRREGRRGAGQPRKAVAGDPQAGRA